MGTEWPQTCGAAPGPSDSIRSGSSTCKSWHSNQRCQVAFLFLGRADGALWLAGIGRDQSLMVMHASAIVARFPSPIHTLRKQGKRHWGGILALLVCILASTVCRNTTFVVHRGLIIGKCVILVTCLLTHTLYLVI